MKKRIDEYRTTTNSSVYNKLHKQVLQKEGKICCSYCKYHKHENKTNKWYGIMDLIHISINRYPSWKLASKKDKQWNEEKGYEKVIRKYTRKFDSQYEYVEFVL